MVSIDCSDSISTLDLILTAFVTILDSSVLVQNFGLTLVFSCFFLDQVCGNSFATPRKKDNQILIFLTASLSVCFLLNGAGRVCV